MSALVTAVSALVTACLARDLAARGRWRRRHWRGGGGASAAAAVHVRTQEAIHVSAPAHGPAPLAGPTVRRSDAGSVGMETGLSDGGHSDAYINSRQEARNAGEVPTQTRREDSDTEMTRITRRIGIAGDDSDNGR